MCLWYSVQGRGEMWLSDGAGLGESSLHQGWLECGEVTPGASQPPPSSLSDDAWWSPDGHPHHSWGGAPCWCLDIAQEASLAQSVLTCVKGGRREEGGEGWSELSDTAGNISVLSCSASVRSKTPGRTVRYKVQSWSWSGMEKLISVINLVSPPPVSCVNLNIQQSWYFISNSPWRTERVIRLLIAFADC